MTAGALGGWAVGRAEAALHGWWREEGRPQVASLDWEQYGRMAQAVCCSLSPRPSFGQFTYRHHPPEERGGKPYDMPLSYFDSGGEGEPLIAIGGLINVVQRFEFMAIDAQPEVRVIAVDLAGRGRSGWMRDIEDYGMDSYIEQLEQCMDHFGLSACSLCGSSMGGSIAIRFASLYPERVRRIVLNDSAPYIPVERRTHRAKAVARHYVFSSPAQMIRRTGAASKPFGPIPESSLLHVSYHQTRWSGKENGRMYRHDLRAMLSYKEEAKQSLDLWREWSEVRCPVLLLHGMLSDATTPDTIDRMRGHDGLSVLHIADTGHTPPLYEGLLTRQIVSWLLNDEPFAEDRHHQLATTADKRVFAGAG